MEVRSAKLSSKFFYNKKLKLLEITKEINRKGHAKIEKYVCYIYTENICSPCNPMQVVVFR